MEQVVTEVVAPIVKTTVESVCSCVGSMIKTTISLQSNLAAAEREMKGLTIRREEVKRETKASEKEEYDIQASVVAWLDNIEKLECRFDQILEKKPSACFLNCSKRYRESKEVEEIREEIKNFLEVGKFPNGLVYPTKVPRAVVHEPGTLIQGQPTASKILAMTKEALYDDKVRRIGIWGLGGVGKTTLVQNLNNELKDTASTQPFGIIIWATVSKNLVTKNVQMQIAARLNLEVKNEDSVDILKFRLSQRLEKEEKFLLILDDVWDKINLAILGVPDPEVHKGYKIILTSRRMEVCRSMITDVEIKMELLNEEEAWQLFSQKAGDVAHRKEIKPFAEAIAREGCGLPLAITIMGASMRGKTKVELWDNALKELQRSKPLGEDIEAKVYQCLKWSYDSLKGNNVKFCFLYCSLFPEDFSIEISELINYWKAEGLIDEEQNYVDSVNSGITLIENLKDSCLLEDGVRDGTVKMHDVVRDVAIWIASSSEDGCKSLVRSGIGLSEISVREFTNSDNLKRISFMNNEITRLPDCMIQCSEASTLLLQGNRGFETVPEKFLLGFKALRILNLSGTRIHSLPHSLLQLSDLRALLLGSCGCLEELPPLESLPKLQKLDLSYTRITKLPTEMENLSELRQLNISSTYELKTIGTKIISRLSSLEVLNMTISGFHLRLKGEEDGQATFEELRSLERLRDLSITLNRIPCDKSDDLSWISRLRKFHFHIIQPNGGGTLRTHDKRSNIQLLNLSGESIGWYWNNSSYLHLDLCEGLAEMLEDFIKSDASFANLKSLTISNCFTSLGREGGCVARSDLLPNLEELHLWNVGNLKSISELASHLRLKFHSLKSIEVKNCNQMKYLLSCGDFNRTLPNLEDIKVSRCVILDELFNYDSVQIMASDPIVPNLQKLALKRLPKLITLCRNEETWPRLEQVEVVGCKHLRRLPLSNQNTGTMKEIIRDSQWWNALEWDDDQTKSSLLPFFHPQ